MHIIKALNNNVVLARGDGGEELVLFGSGLGFNPTQNRPIDPSKIMKEFRLAKSTRFSDVMDGIDPRLLIASEKMIEEGRKHIGRPVLDSILVTLTDHLRYAMKREAAGMELKNPLQWEVPHVYPLEYKVGQRSLEIFRDEMGQTLCSDEAAFIALHFVNAQFENEAMGDTIALVRMCKDIISIVNYHYQTQIDEESVDCARFIVHLRYFIIRQKNSACERALSNSDVFNWRKASSPR